jgi:hypothetical protein
MFIEKHTRNVSQLDDKHVLGGTRINSCFQKNSKKFVILAEFGNFGELVLKVYPDVVALPTSCLLRHQKNRLF